MSHRWTTAGLLAAILLQAGVLATEYLNSVHPLWTGREIRLKTVPVDPRSLFRGNYARLNYEISTITLPEDMQIPALRHGEFVYVQLQQGDDGLYGIEAASLTEPESGMFIRGRIQHPFRRPGMSTYQVRYGIEAYFAPKEKALSLEKDLRRGGIAIVMVADNGKAALKNVIPNAKQEGTDDVEDPNETERPVLLETTPEEIQIGQELIFLK